MNSRLRKNVSDLSSPIRNNDNCLTNHYMLKGMTIMEKEKKWSQVKRLRTVGLGKGLQNEQGCQVRVSLSEGDT